MYVDYMHIAGNTTAYESDSTIGGCYVCYYISILTITQAKDNYELHNLHFSYITSLTSYVYLLAPSCITTAKLKLSHFNATSII